MNEILLFRIVLICISLPLLKLGSTTAYSNITFRHFGLRAPPNLRWTGMLAFEGLYYKGFEWRYHTNMANDHCSVNCCTNNKRNISGTDLSFFNCCRDKTLLIIDND